MPSLPYLPGLPWRLARCRTLTRPSQYLPQRAPKTTLVYEYPTDEGDPYYHVPTAANAALYAKYQALAADTPDVQFLGRLGTYRYYNMDQVVAQALAHYSKMAGVPRREIAA